MCASRVRKYLFITPVLALLITTNAIAQNAQEVRLEEVVVTAQKREEKLKDVPIAIVAVSGESLKVNAIHDLEELSSAVPDVHIGQSFSQGFLSIRGLTSGFNPGFESTVGQVVDGYFYPRDRFAYLAFMDLDRLEILKGPQGALIGKNTTAGAINITTQGPTNTLAASTQIEREVSGDPGWNTESAVSGPILGSLQGRLAIRTENHNGFLDNLFTGVPEPTRTDKYGRLTLLWTPRDDLSVTLRAARGEKNSVGRNIELISCDQPFRNRLATAGLTSSEDCILNWKTGDNTAIPALGPGQFNGHTTVADIENLTLVWDTALGTVTSLSGYADFNFRGWETGLKTVFATRAVQLGEKWGQFSEELRLVSNPGARIDYIVGAYFLKSHQRTSNGIGTFGPPFTTQYIIANANSTTYSPFGDLTWHISSAFDATLEARYTKEEKNVNLWANNTGIFNPALVVSQVYSISPRRSESNFSPGIKLLWKPTTDILVYGSWNEGYKGGGFNNNLAATNNTTAQAQAQFEPEKTTAFELGTKWNLAGGRALFTAAAFRSQTSDLQVTAVIPLSSGFAVENAARTTNQGVEADLSWRPIEPLTLTLRGAYLDATYENFTGSQCYRAQTAAQGCVGTLQDLSGTQIPFSPKTSGSFDARYDWNLANDLQLSLYGQVIYSDQFQTDFTNDPNAVQKSFRKYNARLALASRHWELAFVGRNLSNEPTFAAAGAIQLTSGGTDFAEVEPPRELFVQLSLKY